MSSVSVLIPTFHRPDRLRRAARSVFAQKGVRDVEIVVVENSPDGDALPVIAELNRTAPVPVQWACEPKPGVAHARNAALTLARGEFVAWLDDDQEASPHWLSSLLQTRRETGAQSVFGSVYALAPRGSRHAGFAEQLYSRTGPATSGLIERAHGIGNSLQPRAMFSDNEFDPRANETGGEDDTLFSSWRRAGARFGWAPDAMVIEHVDARRARLAHGLKRAFAYGQGPCETAWKERDIPALVRHMSVGVAQTLAYSAGASVATLVNSPRKVEMLDRAARGAGKVFWFCEQRFYGSATR